MQRALHDAPAADRTRREALIAGYAPFARLLGTRLRELHAALGDAFVGHGDLALAHVLLDAGDVRFFRSTPDATPTERWLAASMDHLASLEAAHGVSTPIALPPSTRIRATFMFSITSAPRLRAPAASACVTSMGLT